MENPETAATLGTRHRTKTNETKNTTQKKKNNTDTTNKPR
jgi:hypothetical protein